MFYQLIGRRIKVLRETKGLTQRELADLLGFKNRQTISAIESGIRRVTADEIMSVVENLGEDFDYFIDHFRLVGEGQFSWRKANVNERTLSAYEYKAGRCIAAYRTLARQLGHEPPLLRQSLTLDINSTQEDAMLAGERMAGKFAFGHVPALQLRDVMEKKFGILSLMVEAEEGISGAACRLPELDTVLIARRKAAGRRYFTLAHEFFHILTWDALPPQHSEKDQEMTGNRRERLADVFAAALLMPEGMLEPFGSWSKVSESELISRLNAVAPELRVTPGALLWRLVALGKIKQATARALPPEALHDVGDEADIAGNPPPLFSKRFMRVIGQGLRKGTVSTRLLARIFEITIDEFSDLFVQHGMKSPIGI